MAAAVRGAYADLGGWPADTQLPICYSPAYNISFWGLERLHPFDSKKFQHVLALLEARGVLSAGQLVEAQEATHAVLREVHTERYLNKLNRSSLKVAMVSWRGGLRLMWEAVLLMLLCVLLSCHKVSARHRLLPTNRNRRSRSWPPWRSCQPSCCAARCCSPWRPWREAPCWLLRWPCSTAGPSTLAVASTTRHPTM